MVEYHCHDFDHNELLEEGEAFIRKVESWIADGLAGKPFPTCNHLYQILVSFTEGDKRSAPLAEY